MAKMPMAMMKYIKGKPPVQEGKEEGKGHEKKETPAKKRQERKTGK